MSCAKQRTWLPLTTSFLRCADVTLRRLNSARCHLGSQRSGSGGGSPPLGSSGL